VLDYHLHLWPHEQSDAETTIEQVVAYCERATAAGVTEIALTEHLFRFTQARDRLGGFWDDLPPEALRPGMSEYWAHHARVDLDAYVEVVEAAKAEGLPVVLGLEVDYYQDRMDDVADLLAGYPFDVLLGSVHWLGAWRFDVLSDPLVLAEWGTRAVDAVWDEYTRAMEELGASGVCDVFAHPDLVKVYGLVHLSADAGSVTGRDVGGFFDVATQAGSVRLEINDLQPGEHRIRAAAGSVRLELARGMDVSIETHTSMGSVRNRYPSRPSATTRLILSTEMGSVRVDEGGSYRSSRRPGPPSAPPPPRRPEPPREDPELERILKMVEAGELSAQDADELLRAMGRV